MRPCTSILPASAEIRVMPMMASQKNSIGLNDKHERLDHRQDQRQADDADHAANAGRASDAPSARPAWPARTMG